MLAPRTLDPEVAWLMNSMLQDVIKRGTGRQASSLGRKDLAGKTGTTNNPCGRLVLRLCTEPGDHRVGGTGHADIPGLG